MTVYSSSDIPLEDMLNFASNTGPELGIKVAEGQFHHKSAEAPSLITLLAQIRWWHALGIAVLTVATKYGQTLAESAAKDTWANRREIVAGTTDGIKQLGWAIAKMVRRSKPGTQISIGIPFPNDYFSTHLELENVDEESASMQIRMFLRHLPALEALINELQQTPPATGIFLRAIEDDALEACWFDGTNLQKLTRILRLPPCSGTEA
jgi:hypothetical protein